MVFPRARECSQRERPQVRYYLGECSTMTKREAERQRDEIIDQEQVNQPQVRLRAQTKFSEALTAYRKTFLPSVREVTARNYENIIQNHIEPAFGSLRMCDIDFAAVQSWVNRLDMCGSTKRTVVAVFNSIWMAARRMNYTREVTPAEAVRISGKQSDRVQRILTWDEWRRFRAALPENYQLLADLLMFTAVRISEALGLTWAKLDLSAGVARVEQRLDQMGVIDAPKSKAGRRPVPLGPLVPALAARRLKSESEFVFPNMPYVDVQRAFIKAGKAVGIAWSGFGAHSLRKTLNSWLRNNASASVAKAQLGHATMATNDIYLLAAGNAMKEQQEAIGRAYAEAMGEGGKVQ